MARRREAHYIRVERIRTLSAAKSFFEELKSVHDYEGFSCTKFCEYREE